jgi:uncharacterized protein
VLPLALSIPLVVLAGVVAGVINTVVGSGSLVTYPVLVLAGVNPVAANITNTVGLAPGAVAGAVAFRRELTGQRPVVVRLLPASIVGAIVGAVLLRVLPASAFPYVVPVLILFATALVAFQPVIARRARGSEGRTRWVALIVCVLAASVYGGYFSAAQGIILLGILGVFLEATLTEQNAVKNLLQATVNVVAAVFFLIAGGADLLFAACVAVGSLAGAPLGAVVARRVPARAFRIGLVCFGLLVTVIMVLRLVVG